MISLQVRGPNGNVLEVDLKIDTGFTGYLTLTSADVLALELGDSANEPYSFADDETKVLTSYAARVLWDHSWTEVRALVLPRSRLVGMSLLRGYIIGLEAVPSGDITIELMEDG